jgi:hypothetical protein
MGQQVKNPPTIVPHPAQMLDTNGISFAEYRSLLPDRIFEFPKPRVKKNRIVLAAVGREGLFCCNCREPNGRGLEARLQLHHLVGGSNGRSDERTNLMHLCGRDACHPSANTKALPFARLLFLKWYYYPDEVDWVRLAILRHQFHPDLVLHAADAV